MNITTKENFILPSVVLFNYAHALRTITLSEGVGTQWMSHFHDSLLGVFMHLGNYLLQGHIQKVLDRY